MEILKKDWFSDKEQEESHCFSMKVDEVLYHKKSKFQDILVFKK